ncbi:MAG: hypothetical protein ACI9C1_001212 [Candidatus Aldehydirespiratoraceae bacterium]
MKLRRLWKPLSGAALLVVGLLIGTSSPVVAATGGCAGDVVVALDVPVWSRAGYDTYGFALSQPLAAGEWRVGTSSSDAYVGRSASSQSQEQWLLDITDHVVLGPTSDLIDGVDSTRTADSLGTFVSASGVSHFTIRHAAASTPNGTNSVTADCVSFTEVAVPPTTTVPPTTVPTTTVPDSATTTVPATTTAAPTTTVPKATTTTLPVATSTTISPPNTAPPKNTVPPTTTRRSTVPPAVPPSTTAPAGLSADIRATAVVDCLNDTVLVLLGNEGSLGATVDIALPLSGIRSGVSVGAGAQTTSTLAVGDLGGSTEIRVSDSVTGEVYVRTDISVDCADPARPTATTIIDCVADVLIVQLANAAGDPAELTVLHERVAVVAEFTIEAGDAAEVEIVLAGAERVPVRVVDADGDEVIRIDVANPCEGANDETPTDDSLDDGSPDANGPDSNGASGASGDGVDCSGETGSVLPGECGQVVVVVSPDCPSSSAAVSVRRDGRGRERFVVFVAGEVAGIVAIDGTGEGTVPVRLDGDEAELTISRSSTAEAIVVGTVRCEGDRGLAGPIAASMVVLAVLASAAGVFPWPTRLFSP